MRGGSSWLVDVMGAIDCDPASSAHAQQTVQASSTTEQEPYARGQTESFIAKLSEEIEAGRTTEAIILTDNHSETAWFHRLGHLSAGIAFTSGTTAATAFRVNLLQRPAIIDRVWREEVRRQRGD